MECQKVTYPMQRLIDRRRAKLVDELHDVTCEIDRIRQRMDELGLGPVAESLRTTLQDLRWQSEELVNESRRPASQSTTSSVSVGSSRR